MTTRLRREVLPRVPHTPARPAPEAGIVHLGLGNFHRAHQAVYTARALEVEPGPWGIVGVASRSRAVVNAMRAQDGLYTVLSLSPDTAEALVVGVHSELFVAADQPDELVDTIADPRTRIVTVTVTEHGYTYSAATRGLDLELPQVQADLAGSPPSTTIGQLARGLHRRYRTHGEPVTVLNCDNLTQNGEHTRALVLEFVAALADAAESDAAELHDWIKASVTFPSTMVDRIVPATEDTHRALVRDLLGINDAVPVPAEWFSMWVLEDDFVAGRPRWDATGAIFADEVGPYEVLKLRLLNGTHSLIAYLGLLAGVRTIAQAAALPEIRAAAEHVMREEYLPTLKVPTGLDVEQYMAQLFARFGNYATGHRASQVASDGSLKLPVRITEPIEMHHAAGAVPRLIALTVAGYIRCLATPDSYAADAQGAVRDPHRDRLEALGRRHRDSRALVRAVFEEAGVFAPSLAETTLFVDAVIELHGALTRHGYQAGVAAALR